MKGDKDLDAYSSVVPPIDEQKSAERLGIVIEHKGHWNVSALWHVKIERCDEETNTGGSIRQA
jgi:hypothetical protein